MAMITIVTVGSPAFVLIRHILDSPL